MNDRAALSALATSVANAESTAARDAAIAIASAAASNAAIAAASAAVNDAAIATAHVATSDETITAAGIAAAIPAALLQVLFQHYLQRLL